MFLPAASIAQPAIDFARTDLPLLRPSYTVREALDVIRGGTLGERIVYFYILDDERRLLGVVPTRRLLTAPLEKLLADIMIASIVSLPATATLEDAYAMFARHKFLALPILDDERRLLGVLDVGAISDGVLDLQGRDRMDELFEAFGLHLSQLRDASALRAFGFRIPWLMATIASGTICALLAGVFELTLAKSLILAFFLTLVLGLGESVSIQSMTVAIHALRSMRPTLSWYGRSLAREVGTAILLGTTCGLVVATIAALWVGPSMPALVIGLSIALILLEACVIGLTVPTLLHAFQIDPKIAAGPVTLALIDIGTIVTYFGLATILIP